MRQNILFLCVYCVVQRCLFILSLLINAYNQPVNITPTSQVVGDTFIFCISIAFENELHWQTVITTWVLKFCCTTRDRRSGIYRCLWLHVRDTLLVETGLISSSSLAGTISFKKRLSIPAKPTAHVRTPWDAMLCLRNITDRNRRLEQR